MIIGTFVLLTVRCRGKESNLFHETTTLNTGSACPVLGQISDLNPLKIKVKGQKTIKQATTFEI